MRTLQKEEIPVSVLALSPCWPLVPLREGDLVSWLVSLGDDPMKYTGPLEIHESVHCVRCHTANPSFWPLIHSECSHVCILCLLAEPITARFTVVLSASL